MIDMTSGEGSYAWTWIDLRGSCEQHLLVHSSSPCEKVITRFNSVQPASPTMRSGETDVTAQFGLASFDHRRVAAPLNSPRLSSPPNSKSALASLLHMNLSHVAVPSFIFRFHVRLPCISIIARMTEGSTVLGRANGQPASWLMTGRRHHGVYRQEAKGTESVHSLDP
jgi:hypothetical protein